MSVISNESDESLGFKEIIDNISDAMSEMDGETIAEIHNQILSRKIVYKEDSIWEYSGEND
jgi:hypothetical protein